MKSPELVRMRHFHTVFQQRPLMVLDVPPRIPLDIFWATTISTALMFPHRGIMERELRLWARTPHWTLEPMHYHDEQGLPALPNTGSRQAHPEVKAWGLQRFCRDGYACKGLLRFWVVSLSGFRRRIACQFLNSWYVWIFQGRLDGSASCRATQV